MLIIMLAPKTQRRYCIYCRKHTLHDVKRSSGHKKSPLREGERRFHRKMKGFGSFPKSNPKDREKPTRKVDLRYKCAECKKEHNIGKGFRVKKFEIQTEKKEK